MTVAFPAQGGDIASLFPESRTEMLNEL